MVGFFHQIRGKFKHNFSGRYLTTLLSELAERDARSFSRIFYLDKKNEIALKAGLLQIKPEWEYSAFGGNRRLVDLAVLDGGEPILLIEIKEDDVNNKKNEAQLIDYLKMISLREGAVSFVHLSRYSPVRRDKDLLDKAICRHTKLLTSEV